MTRQNRCDQSEATSFFEKLYDKHGCTAKALAYGSERTQHRKFQVLSEVANLEGSSVLDVGCGFGDLHQYLLGRGISCEYQGIDIVPKIIAAGREKYPGLSLDVGDILAHRGQREYDYVLCTGFNCVRGEDNWEILTRAIETMYGLCMRAAAVGMVSKYRERKDSQTYYAGPDKVFSFCMGLTKRVTLRHDYMPHDFTVYLYRE